MVDGGGRGVVGGFGVGDKSSGVRNFSGNQAGVCQSYRPSGLTIIGKNRAELNTRFTFTSVVF